jgi:hypothetical protein
LHDVEQVELLGDGKGWKTTRGSVGIWQPGEGLLIVQAQGHGSEEFAGPCIKALDDVVAVSRPVHIFADFGKVQSYDSQFRIKLTSRIVQRRADVSAVDILVQSRIVAMGVAVANLALGGLLSSFSRRPDFHSALDAALKEAGIVDFSSRTLVAA